jgi:hypothetical protein
VNPLVRLLQFLENDEGFFVLQIAIIPGLVFLACMAFGTP